MDDVPNVEQKKQEQKRTHFHSIHIGNSRADKTDLIEVRRTVIFGGGERWENEGDFLGDGNVLNLDLGRDCRCVVCVYIHIYFIYKIIEPYT